MKKRNLKRIFAAFMATALAVSTVACGDKDTPGTTDGGDKTTPEPTKEASTPDDGNKGGETVDTTTPEPTPEAPVLLTDKDGKVMDLGGMHIVVRDWWSDAEGNWPEATSEFMEAQQEWWTECQENYNFTITSQAISDWAGAAPDFVDYVTTNGDENNYVFVLHGDPAIISSMQQGLMYDLATIPWLDFTREKFTRNKNHELYALGSSIYGMATGYSEARTGVYFNKQVLTDAGIDPETLYDMQADGTWTWDKFDELCAKCQRDLDADGVNDIYGITLNEGVMTDMAVFSNGGAYIGKDENGFTVDLAKPETQDALKFCVDMYTKYDQHDPEGANWDYYQEEWKSGKVAFLIDQAYCSAKGNLFETLDFDIGFVMFPKGPAASTYLNCWDNNIIVIPGCYDKDRAEKIAFAYNLYTDMPAGYENYKDLSNYISGAFDERSIDETISMMMEPEHGMVSYHGLVPNLNLGPDLTWGIGPNGDVTQATENIIGTWTEYVNAANGN